MRPIRVKAFALPKKSRVFQNKQGWQAIGGRRIYFRSQWEVRYAAHLDRLKKAGYIANWEHEPKTFWFEQIKRGVRSYKPDFFVTKTDGTTYWVEVKGFMDAKSKTKIKRFNKYYPLETLIVVEADWFKNNKEF